MGTVDEFEVDQPEEVPETRFCDDLVGCKDTHTVDLGVDLCLGGQVTADNLVFLKRRHLWEWVERRGWIRMATGRTVGLPLGRGLGRIKFELILSAFAGLCSSTRMAYLQLGPNADLSLKYSLTLHYDSTCMAVSVTSATVACCCGLIEKTTSLITCAIRPCWASMAIFVLDRNQLQSTSKGLDQTCP